MEIQQIMQLGFSEEDARKVCNEINKQIDSKIQQIEAKAKEEYEAEIQKIKIKNAIEKELTASGARNLKAAMALLKKEELTLENGEIPSLKASIEQLKNSPETSFLFFQEDEKKPKGITPFESRFKKARKVQDMDYEDLCEYYGQMNI